MKTSSALRWAGIAVNGLLYAAAVLVVLAGTAPLGAFLVFAPVALSLWALLPKSPSLAATILGSLANGLLLLIGLFAVVRLGDYGVSSFDISLAWISAVLIPVINILSVLVRRAAAQSSNSFIPNPQQGGA